MYSVNPSFKQCRMKKTVYLLIAFIVLSCGKKNIELPEVEQAYATEPGYGASVSMFYDTAQPDSLDVELNNMDTATRRVFYIDKRLLLKHIIPRLQKLRGEEAGSSKNAKHYFSVTKSDTEALLSLDFSDIIYRANDAFSKFYIKDLPEVHMPFLTLTLNFKMNHEITVDGNPIERSELLSFLREYIDFVSEGKQTLIYLNFNENLSFQDYISNYDLITSISGPDIKIAKIQFVYNEALLPDCNCQL